MAEENRLLRAMRQATASAASPGFALSRSELAELVNTAVYGHTGRVGAVDGHYVAKLERGVIRWPGRAYREAFREVLGASTDSELGFHRPRRDMGVAPSPPAQQHPGEGAAARDRLDRVLSGRCRVDRALVTHLTALLDTQRHMEDVIGSARMLPATRAELAVVEHLIPQARGELQIALVALLAQYHEFAGWMSDHNDDQRGARHHEQRALDAAGDVSDLPLIAAVYGLKAHMAWGARDAASTIALAEAAQQDAPRLSAGLQGLLAQLQARGHALDGNRLFAARLLDRTETITAHACEHPEDEPSWTYQQTPERVPFQRGLADLDLGDYRQASVGLAKAQRILPGSYHRDLGRCAAALALARAHHGDLVGAVATGWQAVAIAQDAGSVYTLADLRRLHRVLVHRGVDPATVYALDQALHDSPPLPPEIDARTHEPQ